MDKQYINPPGIYKHPAFTRVISVSEPEQIYLYRRPNTV